MKKMVITSCCRNLVPPEIVYINNADSQPNVSEENCFVTEELIALGHMLNLQVSFPIKNELGGLHFAK